MRTTPVDWILAKDEMPLKEEFGHYPFLLVALACKGNPEVGHRVQFAELRFFGRDPARPYWVNSGKGPGAMMPIENDAWFVEFWALPFRRPATNQGFQTQNEPS